MKMHKDFWGYRATIFIVIILLSTISLAYPQDKDNSIRTIYIKAISGLKYDLVKFNVKPGERVQIVLTNKDEMSHNLLITKPGAREKVVEAALALAEKGPAMNFIPKLPDVLWSIPVISPDESKSVTFTAPTKPGTYPYVCTYPGHGYMMFGEMRVIEEKIVQVVEKKKVPERDTLVDIPPHPYEMKAPYWYRVFVEGASPAAIAVHLPGAISYCWDAAVCKLRFAWKGDFIDNSDLWKGHFDASAKVLGDIFYRDNTEYPLLIGENATVPKVSYKGYRIVDQYPEFHYTINDLDVYEIIHPNENGTGFSRTFRIPDIRESLWFVVNLENEAVFYETSAGEWSGNRLLLSADEAKEFTVKMTNFHLQFQKKKN